MKKIYILFILLALALVSCERVIQINLNDASPALVVEGRLLQDSLAVVQLHETSNFFSPDTQSGVNNAVVILHNDSDQTDTLNYGENGLYTGTWLLGEEETMYYLSIIHNGIRYEAQSYMYKQPEIYSITQRSFQSFGDFGEDSSGLDIGGSDIGGLLDSLPWFVFTDIKEDSSTQNFYLFRFCINGTTESGRYNVSSDENITGDTLSFSPGPTALVYAGDTVGVRVYTIDEHVYNYFESLNDALSSNPFFSSTPYNPVSNISNGALGYFAAMSLDCDTTVISPIVIEF